MYGAMLPTSWNAVPIRRTSPRRRYSFRAFYITIAIISALAIISLVADQTARYRHGVQYGVAQKRALADPTRLLKRDDEECRLVHHTEDKCAFVRKNCPDEQAGLFSYLELYYCDLYKVKPIAFTILALWLGLLFTTIGIAASDFFCINLSTIASILGMSESMAGVTFLALGNGSPDVFSTFAAMSSHSESLAIGELIGAAGFITAVVAGSMALVREFRVGKKTFVRDVGFFIVAASFSMAFLADGALHMWECCVMIGFYLFYVMVVVLWHWYLGRRRERRRREALARNHYLATTSEEAEIVEEYRDDEDAPAGARRHRDTEDFEALEHGSHAPFASPADDESDEDGEQGMHLAAEMANSMRVTRPNWNRRNTITPIRPSLVGVLEFRSVLSALQKSRGSQGRPIHLRRYSDDPTASVNQHDGTSESVLYSDNASGVIVTAAEDFGNDTSTVNAPARMRAVSMNDAGSSNPIASTPFSVATLPNIGIVTPSPTFPTYLHVPGAIPISSGASEISPTSHSPAVSVKPPASNGGSRDASPAPSYERRKYEGRLAPLEESFPGAQHLRVDFFKDLDHVLGSSKSPGQSPRSRSRDGKRPQLQIPGSSSRDSSHSRPFSPVVQFPLYTDSPVPMSPLPASSRSSKPSSLHLPEPIVNSESAYTDNSQERLERPIKWWPYRFLPSPYVLGSTLFPTLCRWQDKSIWDKFLGVVSAPSIFLLAVTLPIVESETQDDGQEALSALEERRASLAATRNSTGPMLTPDSPSLEVEPEWLRYRRATVTIDRSALSPLLRGVSFSGRSTAGVAMSADNHQNPRSIPIPSKQSSLDLAEDPLQGQLPSSPRDWNRWLVAVQIFTAPLFVVLIIWANTAEGDGRILVNLVLYSVLGSLIVFAILVMTTSSSKPPKYRFLLCFAGFVVSIAWISTIANEVVGVLKAFGVILGISDAILGLTIFAVGNSLGDLVADVTVARLGYPVMALSACFGGPMLNILLGIGISGLYMTIKEADHNHAKHPGKKIRYQPYQIAVSGTLVVSAITLLVTLVGLLIVVPMNMWVMSKRIGWGLIILWSIGTIINLVVEVSGVWGDSVSFW